MRQVLFLRLFLCLALFLWQCADRLDRAVDKREYLMNFSYFSSKPHVVTPHLNRLVEMVQMRGHHICFRQN